MLHIWLATAIRLLGDLKDNRGKFPYRGRHNDLLLFYFSRTVNRVSKQYCDKARENKTILVPSSRLWSLGLFFFSVIEKQHCVLYNELLSHFLFLRINLLFTELFVLKLTLYTDELLVNIFSTIVSLIHCHLRKLQPVTAPDLMGRLLTLLHIFPLSVWRACARETPCLALRLCAFTT